MSRFTEGEFNTEQGRKSDGNDYAVAVDGVMNFSIESSPGPNRLDQQIPNGYGYYLLNMILLLLIRAKLAANISHWLSACHLLDTIYAL